MGAEVCGGRRGAGGLRKLRQRWLERPREERRCGGPEQRRLIVVPQSSLVHRFVVVVVVVAQHGVIVAAAACGLCPSNRHQASARGRHRGRRRSAVAEG